MGKLKSSRRIILIFLLIFFMLASCWILSEIMIIEYKDKSNVRVVPKFSMLEKERIPDHLEHVQKNLFALGTTDPIIAVEINNKSSFFKHDLACASELFVAECDNGGLASALLATLDHLSTCRELGGVPTVFWRNCGTVCSPNATVNSWNWFFEPINPRVEERSKKMLCLAEQLSLKAFYSWYPEYSRRKHNHTFIPELLNLSFKPRNVPGFSKSDLITRQIRYWTNSLIKEYVKVNAKIQEIVDNFYDQHLFGHTVLSVHVRGTDHDTETENGRLPLLTTWIQNAKYILKSLPTPNKIFIASDNSESIKKFVSEFGKKVIFAKAYRAVKYHGKAVHSSYDPYKLGAEVLIDILLMAKGDHFLHAESSVAALVSYFNPEIHTHFLVSKAKNIMNIMKKSVRVAESSQPDIHSESPEELEPTEKESAFKCYEKNRQYSVCSNIRKGMLNFRGDNFRQAKSVINSIDDS